MIRLVLWSLDGDGWQRIAAVPVAADRADAALTNAQSWIPAHLDGLLRFELDPPLPDPVPVLAAVA
ncbi:hypothetical protein ACIBCR_14740 [Micromonospora echinospora]|uniref:hypothetical protein n=1 Tax=Micromonospora echinospora TaxID=1877 RepID=UPI0037B17328